MKHTFSKFSLLAFLLAFLVIGITQTADAQKHQRKSPKAKKERKHARKFLNRTNVFIHKTAKAVKKNKVYTGKLVKAVKHQKRAKQLFKGKRYKKAVHHSYRARKLAFKAFKANKKKNVAKKWELEKDEEALVEDAPDDASIDAEIQGTDQTSNSDEDVVDEKLEDIEPEK